MAFLRTCLFKLFFYGGSLVLVLAALAAVPFGSAILGRATRRWARWHRWCACKILGIETRVEGELPQNDALVVFKHEAMFETIETLVLFDRPVVVMKRELMDIPGWGAAARAYGVIPVDRKAGSGALRQMLAAAKAARAAHRPVVIFPEGTRVPHGQRPPLRAGFAGLYKVLGLPAVPVALDSGRLWRGGFIKRPGIVTMKVGQPIPPGLPREEAEARIHEAINALNPP